MSVTTTPDTTTTTTSTDAVTRDTAQAPHTELTDELAKVLAAVASSADGQVVDVDDAAVSVLASLGLVHETHDGGLFLEWAGREALAAREVAREAAARKKLVDSYVAVVAELHAIADAIDAIGTQMVQRPGGRLQYVNSLDGLAELTLDLRIGTRLYARNPEDDAVNVATVDAVATAVLGITGTTAQLGSSNTWQHKAEARRGQGPFPQVKVEVASFIDDPTARERERAEQDRVAEVERLRAELAEMKAERERAVQALADSMIDDAPRTTEGEDHVR